MHSVRIHPDSDLEERNRRELLRRAQLLLLCRRRRRDIFDAAMFDEAAWDALLALYVDEQGGLTVSAGSLAEQVGIRLHIMMRWIAYLEGHGLVVRGTDALQGRSGLIRLSDKGRSDLERYFADTLVMAAQ